MKPSEVTAVIPTRGNVDLTQVLDSLSECAEVIVWDNSVEEDLGVYGRYAAVERATTPVVYTQDDDCLIDVAAVCAEYEPRTLIANMPLSRWADYPDSALVGWGAVFDRERVWRAFHYWQANRLYALADPVFNRTADVIFSTLTPHRKIDVGFEHLPWAETEGRMFKQRGHKVERDWVLSLARKVKP